MTPEFIVAVVLRFFTGVSRSFLCLRFKHIRIGVCTQRSRFFVCCCQRYYGISLEFYRIFSRRQRALTNSKFITRCDNCG